jgi:large subunit ribosomal protein L17
MRHKRKGRRLGRTSSHRRALLRNLVSSLFLTRRDPDYYEGLFQADGKTPVNPPQFQGRIITTLEKAKEMRPLVEKCITIAKTAIPQQEKADGLAPEAERNSEEWKSWRESDKHRQWVEAMAPVVAARRRVFQLIRDKEAVEILFDDIATDYADREGGYTRILRLAKPRLGDAGTRAILELVGERDRIKQKSAQAPKFVNDTATAEESNDVTDEEEVVDETDAGAGDALGEGSSDDSANESPSEKESS